MISPLAADRILSFIMDFIFHATREFIWKPRCNLVNNEERRKGITRKQKCSPTASNSYIPRTPQGLDAFNELSLQNGILKSTPLSTSIITLWVFR